MRYLYEGHLGRYFVTDAPLSFDDTYCDECGDYDSLVGEFSSIKEFWNLIKGDCDTDGNGGYSLQYVYPLIGLVIGAFGFISSSIPKLEYTIVPLVSFVISIVSLSIGGVGVEAAIDRNINWFKEPTEKYQYEVMIDDSVPFNEVMEKYKVISQRGEIYVLEEK